MLQTVLQAMFSLLAFLSLQSDTLEETQYVHELIAGILGGSANEFDGALVEKEYGITYSAKDAGFVRDCTVVLALSACLENDTAPSCRWALQYLVDVCGIYGICTTVLKPYLGVLALRVSTTLIQTSIYGPVYSTAEPFPSNVALPLPGCERVVEVSPRCRYHHTPPSHSHHPRG